MLKSKQEAITFFNENKQRIKNFKPEEFFCKCGCDDVILSEVLIFALQDLRDELKIPLVISSGFRCKKHNENVGGKENSQHLNGKAVDIACTASTTRFKIITANTVRNQFGALGFHKSFIHLDVRSGDQIAFPY